jgi:hypothetical protein
MILRKSETIRVSWDKSRDKDFIFSRFPPREAHFRLSHVCDISPYTVHPKKSRTQGIGPMNHPEQDEPVYWFVLLEKAIHRGDFDEAALAKRELDRLGVSVIYRFKNKKWPEKKRPPGDPGRPQ